MLGKRKRDQGPAKKPTESLHTPSLTHGNLKRLDAEFAADVASITKNYPSPFDVMAYPSPSTQKKPTASSTNLTKAEHILNLFRFHVNRNKPLPTALQGLVQRITRPRQCDITPNSKSVKYVKDMHRDLSRDMEFLVLIDKLVYRAQWFGDDDMEGKPLIWQGCNDQWSDRIPRPPEAVPTSALAAAMEELGLPKKPKPDMSYGYKEDAFPGDLGALIKSLSADLLVFPKQPWFPYMVVHWKGTAGTVREAEQQVRRDSACAIDTIYRFFQRAHPNQEPSPEHVCMFSLAVYARYCEYRIHWRRVDDDGTISYEGDIISQAFFNDLDAIFKTRGVILETLNWARQERLLAIKVALQALTLKRAVEQAR
ncbi:MAG: hypothetical protein LQ346_008583 [Caloplaca aetnensis]|nr:MAG: hypothetical protein LQ346_008583 [Caloplaca aetnensis]